MGELVQFPTPLPSLDSPQDVGLYTDQINQIIRYINTIVQGSNLSANALLKNLNLSDLGNVATARTNLGLGSAATMDASAFDAAGAAAAVLATSLQKTANLSDLNNAATARTNLGLGTAATHAYGDFDPAGAAAARAAQGINSDITALTALSVIAKTANYQVAAGDQTIEVNAAGGAVTITYLPATAAGRVTIVKTDATYNPVIVYDGTNTIFTLVAPAVSGYCQSVTAYTTGAAIRCI